MTVSLLLPEGCPPRESLPAFDRDALKKDLELDGILDAVSMGDAAIRAAWADAMLSPLADPALIDYRHEVLRDAEAHPEEVRTMYNLCLDADRRQKGSIGTLNWMKNYDLLSTYNGAVEDLLAFTEILKRLRRLAEEYEASFQSRGFRALFRTLREELSDEYLEEVKRRLEELRYPESFLVSARLGSHLQGVGYVLQRQKGKKLNLELLTAGTYRLGEKDDPAKDIAARQARAVNEVTNALAQSALYLYSFFDKLRAELAFYVGCLIFSEGMKSVGMPVCYPTLTPVESDSRAWEELYDVSLVIIKRGGVVGNELKAEQKRLYLVTGANQGGKSTFLRSLGQAQLMAQCGMPVGARRFSAPLRKAVYSHFKREEDRWMISGKLDEELERMRRITDHIRPGDLLLLNESYASTSEREGSELLRQLTLALAECGVEIVSVSHLHSYAVAFRGREDVQFLRAERREDGSRSYRIQPGEPLETAYGEDLYREIFSPA